jgi:sialate O-acetylesterase
MTVRGRRIVVSFDNTGSGLMARNGRRSGHFAIAGEDMQFVWAKARITGEKVMVKNRKVKNPIAVRYAWADNPVGADLYNREGLPAAPFCTDQEIDSRQQVIVNIQ